MNRKITTERGAVALITAMIVSVLLMITTAGMVSLTLKSLRGSTDGAQSTKAYYAAEGGLEEALRQIKDKTYKDNCNGADASGSAKDGAVTCIKVIEKPNELTGTIGMNETVQLDLSSVANLKSLKLEWSTPDGVTFDASKIPNYIQSGFPGAQNSSAATKWDPKAPAIMEMGVVAYPTGTFSITQVGFRQATLAPKSKTISDPSGGIQPAPGLYDNADPKTDLGKPIVTVCDKPAPYQCVAGARLDPNYRYVIRLKTRYNGAKYRLIAQDLNNSALAIPGATYTVDVTARAGDVFRRIQTSFGTGSSTPSAARGLDYVLYSDTDICKSFQVTGAGAGSLDSGLSCLP